MVKKSNVIIKILLFLLVEFYLLTLLNNQAQFLTWTSTNWGGYLPASTGEF